MYEKRSKKRSMAASNTSCGCAAPCQFKKKGHELIIYIYIYDNQRTTSTNCKKAPSRYFAQSEVVLIVMTFSKKLFTMEGNAALSLRFFLS